MIVKVVEADFAAGQDFRLLQQVVEFGIGGVVGKARFVGVNSGAGPDFRDAGMAGKLAADFESLLHSVGSLADADRENLANARSPGALEERGAILVVARTVEMGVGVDHGLVIAGGEGYPPPPWVLGVVSCKYVILMGEVFLVCPLPI